MNECIELHDSVVQSLGWINDAVVLTLNPAIIHRSAGRPAKDAGTVWVGCATIRVRAPRPTVLDLPATIWRGTLETAGASTEDCILPSSGSYNTAVRLQLDFDNGESLDLHGHSMTIQREDECTYLEEFGP